MTAIVCSVLGVRSWVFGLGEPLVKSDGRCESRSDVVMETPMEAVASATMQEILRFA